ncbi:hypothetical protein LBMAG42_48910 [Deltaproteobacteria bacterium]|nr:hypothetical protein LBMAG42_48910 [Deltaproteobacteria bacterium]
MRLRPLIALSFPLAALGLWFAAPKLGLARFIPDQRREPPTARPTEVTEGQGEAEEENHEARKAWIEARHRAGPGVDWRAVERTNGVAATARRTRLKTAAPPPSGTADDPARWTERGSVNQAGRTHVARWSTDRSTLYVGSALGGLWARDAAGVWAPLSDGLYGGVHWLEVLSPEVLGEPDILVVGTDGGLLHRSTDGGATWTEPTGLDWSWAQRRVIATSDGENTLFAVRGNSDGYGVDRSLDRGATWARVLDLGDFGGDVWLPRTGGSTVWAATEGALVRSEDRGESWVKVGDLPTADGVQLAGSEAWTGADGAPRLWLVVHERELWRSDDGGATFVDLGAIEDDWGALAASTLNADLLVYGGVELHKSVDGGATFTVQNAWSDYYDDVVNKLHADIDGVDVLPDGTGGEDWYINTDGGTYRSADALATTQNQSLSGLRVSQYYGTLTSTKDSSHVAAGAQDQGYQVSTNQGGEGDLFNFDQVISGDFAHLVSGDGTHELVYSVYPGWVLIQVGELAPQITWGEFPSAARSYAWLPPLAVDPDDPETFYFLGDGLWQFTRQSHWGWEPARWTEQSFAESDGEYLSALAFSPVDHERVYGVTSVGRLFRSDDHGETWALTARGLPDGSYFYGTALVASALAVDTVYVGGSGYSNPAVYVSHDGGGHFDALSDGLPATLVYSLVEEPTSGVLFAGTEMSAFRLDPRATTWVDIAGTGAPITPYWSAEIVAEAGIVRFGTYGRGIWDYVYDTELDGCVDGTDADGDSAACETDCAVDDATIYPGATEVCGDAVDQDCDGADVECVADPPGTGSGTPEPGPCGCGGEGAMGWIGAGIAGIIARRRRGQAPIAAMPSAIDTSRSRS